MCWAQKGQSNNRLERSSKLYIQWKCCHEVLNRETIAGNQIGQSTPHFLFTTSVLIQQTRTNLRSLTISEILSWSSEHERVDIKNEKSTQMYASGESCWI